MTQQNLNKAVTLLNKGQYPDAIAAFEIVLQHQPNSAAAFRGISYCHARLSNWQPSLTACLNALGHGGNHPEDLVMLINILEASQLQSYVPLVEEAIKLAMLHLPIEKQATQALAIQFKAKYQPFFSFPEMMKFDEPFIRMLQDDSLSKLIQRICIADYTLEKILLLGRRELLQLVAAGEDVSPCLPFLAALACQTLLNDGLYITSDEEQTLLQTLAEKQDDIQALVLRICYADLNTAITLYQQHQATFKTSKLNQLVSDLVFYTNVVASNDTGGVANETSKVVQSFYMQNPYPKWKAIQTNALSIVQIFNKLGKTVKEAANILVAGCGTGKQVIEWAIVNPKAKITAIDLSPTSIAYASQMAEHYAVTNVDFKVLDILDVGHLDQSFDYIVSTGVLHHMKSPQDGLNALSKSLRAGGVMSLALYSKMARRDLASIKAEIIDYLGADEAGVTPQGVCQWRAQLTDEDKQRDWFGIGEFFYLNGLYDLLFHPQQAEYSALEIQSLLDNAGLDFKWMPITQKHQQIYQQAFEHLPIPKSGETLQYWHEFEQKCPNFFSGMFQFFVVKPDNGG